MIHDPAASARPLLPRLRIAQVAPLAESVPPRGYGGTERIVSYLTEELVELGHEVTLFASGDSITDARLEPCCPRAVRLDPTCSAPLAYQAVQLGRVFERAADFDFVHFHVDWLHLPFLRGLQAAALTTCHGRLDLPEAGLAFREFPDASFASISDSQRSPVPHAAWIGTVHHGLPANLLRPRAGAGGYLAFLGRISPEKRPDRAIRIARATGRALRIAAKIDDADRGYFEAVVRPFLAEPGVEFVGEIGEREKAAFLGDAAALLFPIDWPEPFGLVMIEAMACGTPVIACRRGAVPEILEHGVTGFIVEDEIAAAAAVGRLRELDRGRIRAEFERRFTARRMAEDYLRLYRILLAERQPGVARVMAPPPAARLAT